MNTYAITELFTYLPFLKRPMPYITQAVSIASLFHLHWDNFDKDPATHSTSIRTAQNPQTDPK